MRGARLLQLIAAALVVAILYFVVTTWRFHALDSSVASDIWRYPRLEQLFRMQTGDGYLTKNRTALVAISTLQGDDHSAQLQSVAPSGREWHVRDVFNWAMQNMGQRQLTPAQLEQLRQAVHDLPAENSYPDAGDLVIVSFPDGANWTARCYDKRTPPEALKRIEAIIAAAHELTFFELQDEAATAAKKTVAAAREAVPPDSQAPEIKLSDAVAQSIAIFTGTLTNLDGPRDAQLGLARYYGTVILGQTLRGPVASHNAVFNHNDSTDPGTFVSIDARLLPDYDENQANIFFAIKTDYQHPPTTVGSEYTILKILPATEANLAQVRQLLPTTDDTK